MVLLALLTRIDPCKALAQVRLYMLPVNLDDDGPSMLNLPYLVLVIEGSSSPASNIY